ncbi:MAG TPA: VOC family protein [Acidimicrobiia bacterium]|nr:VOC family protein [Acidimicrobiia bacterium]
MPKRSDAPVGAPCWIDLFTSDPEKSCAFYADLFGWTFESAGDEFGGYINFSKDGDRVAGAMRNDGSTEQPDCWNVYLAVTDAKATVDKAQANGAQVIVPAMDVGELGMMAVVTDPGSAAIGMWQPGLHRGFGVYDEPGTAGWFELHTRAYQPTIDFYRKVFGWNVETASDSDDLRYSVLQQGEEQFAGIMDASSFLPAEAPARWDVYFKAADADATLAQITQNGGKVVQPAEDTPYGRLAVATDPTGALFRLVQR